MGANHWWGKEAIKIKQKGESGFLTTIPVRNEKIKPSSKNLNKSYEEQKRLNSDPNDPYNLRNMDVSSAFQKLRKKSAQAKIQVDSKELTGVSKNNKDKPNKNDEDMKKSEEDDEMLEAYVDGESDIETLNESDYELGHMIYKSNISIVYRALHYNAAKLIIVKSIEYDPLTSEEFEERINYLKENISNIK